MADGAIPACNLELGGCFSCKSSQAAVMLKVQAANKVVTCVLDL
jgi:hypothetical protein